MSRKLWGIVGLVMLLSVSAGCSGLVGGPQISDVQTGVTSETIPYIAFNYSVDDYSTANLEGPDGEIVSDHELSTNENISAFRMSNPREG
ncbi:MAG: hypothetical protein ABEI86_14910, partial [Halobacteriaceae archaeon]